jgi:uncharacterized membrane protein YvlD (DUF360 family)
MQEFENYKKEKLTIDLVWANVFGILILIPIVLIFGLPYYLLWHPKMEIKDFMDNLLPQDAALGGLSVFGILILGIIVHELIHGIVWSRFAKGGFRSIKFGVLWKMLTPYCHCNEPLTVKQYIWGAIMPAITLGFIPSILAILTGNFGMLIFGMFFTMAAAGDFMIINLIRKENKNDFVQDHPSEAGCYIYRKTEEKATQ